MKLTEILKSIFPCLRIPKDRHLTSNELEFLEVLASELKENSTILEIGCKKGASTYGLAKGAKENMSEIYSVAAIDALPLAELTNIFWKLRFPDVDILPPSFSASQWKERLPVDFFYVNNAQDISDYVLWEKFIAKDAMIAYHDTNWPRNGKKETTEQVNGLIQKVKGKCVQSVDSITSFILPG